MTLIFVILFSQNPLFLFGLLTLQIFLLHQFINYPILFYLLSGLGGIGSEIFAIKFGKQTWKYKQNHFFGIPIWLYPLWILAGITIIAIYDLAKIFS